jgi:hypothetical protein
MYRGFNVIFKEMISKGNHFAKINKGNKREEGKQEKRYEMISKSSVI